LKTFGWIEGRNLIVDVRPGSADYQQMNDTAKQLISLRTDVIVAQGSPAVAAVRQYSRTLPVVFIPRSRVMSRASLGRVDLQQGSPALSSPSEGNGSICFAKLIRA
jgi:ABC-type uncharacterized transport system substrate-binding protein